MFDVKDHTVTGQVFTIVECKECTLRFTQDVPDAESIGPYYKSEEYISHTNTAKGFVNRMYQFVRKRTLGRKLRLVQSATGLQDGYLLDVGAGIGSFVHHIKQAGWEATGLEPDADATKVAQQTYGLELQGMQTFYSLAAGTFDAITLWHVLEHVHELDRYVEQLKSLLKPTGRLFIAVPNYTSLDARLYKSNWAAYDVPRHLYHFSPASLAVLMRAHGLSVLQYKPMWYDSFYISILSSKYRRGKPSLPGAFINGMRSNINAIFDVRKCSSVIYVVGK